MKAAALAFPVANGKSKIGDRWGARRDGGKRKHMGVDIYASKGTPVVAITDGIIVERANMPVGGKTLWLKAADHRWTAYYAHLDKQLVREGQLVRKGQVIGTVGNTGNARNMPAHLHFGIDDGKNWTNPLPYINGSSKVIVKTTKRKVTGSRKVKTKANRARR